MTDRTSLERVCADVMEEMHHPDISERMRKIARLFGYSLADLSQSDRDTLRRILRS